MKPPIYLYLRDWTIYLLDWNTKRGRDTYINSNKTTSLVASLIYNIQTKYYIKNYYNRKDN